MEAANGPTTPGGRRDPGRPRHRRDPRRAGQRRRRDRQLLRVGAGPAEVLLARRGGGHQAAPAAVRGAGPGAWTRATSWPPTGAPPRSRWPSSAWRPPRACVRSIRDHGRRRPAALRGAGRGRPTPSRTPTPSAPRRPGWWCSPRCRSPDTSWTPPTSTRARTTLEPIVRGVRADRHAGAGRRPGGRPAHRHPGGGRRGRPGRLPQALGARRRGRACSSRATRRPRSRSTGCAWGWASARTRAWTSTWRAWPRWIWTCTWPAWCTGPRSWPSRTAAARGSPAPAAPGGAGQLRGTHRRGLRRTAGTSTIWASDAAVVARAGADPGDFARASLK